MTTAKPINFFHKAQVEPQLSTQQTDSILLARIARHERPALSEFYDRFHLRLFGYLFRITGNHFVAEDVLQEVMLVVWQKANSYKGDGKPSTWVFGIAHNLALAALRRDRTSDWLNWDDTDQTESNDDLLEESVIRQATAEAVIKAMSKLSPEHRAVLELVFYQDFSSKEIATIIQVPEGTVKSRLSYARKLLKAALLSGREEM